MKSRTSSFNLTVFKKDLTRFAPGWGAYLIFMLLVLMMLTDSGQAYYRLMDMEGFIIAAAWFNLIYAGVVAQLVFGDLYNSRLCNALHAMPVTRDGWFVTHCAAGVAFSLIPNLVIALLALPVLQLEAGWVSIPLWLLATELQYLFFFGVAVLCVMLSGNRLGMLALYAIINFAGLIAYWLASCVYQPLLYGIQINGELFYPFCPVGEISQMHELLIIDAERIEDELGNFMYNEILGVAPGEGWGYMAIIAGVGILALIGALALYRKRDLECAGDFVAFRKTEPAVLVLVTLCAGGFFHLMGDMFGMNMKYILLFTGMIVGFFACQMLLERTTRVFRKGTIVDCASILILFALTLGITAWDPAGITTYMPELEEIESITFSDSYSIHRHSDYDYTVTEEGDIEAILSVHADCIDGDAKDIEDLHPDSYDLMDIRLEYKLKNGKTVNRFYSIYCPSKAGQVLKQYYTRPECVLGFPKEQVPEMAKYIQHIYAGGNGDYQYLMEYDLEALLNAIVADCEAGNMAPFSGYHLPQGRPVQGGEVLDDHIAYLEIGWDHEKLATSQMAESTAFGIINYSSLRIFRSCTNTLNWLMENDLLNEEQLKEMAIKFDGPTATFETIMK